MKLRFQFPILVSMFCLSCSTVPLRGTGDLGVIIERANGKILIIETTTRTRLKEIEGLGDLSHASVSFSKDAKYAFVFGRDGGLTKVDLLAGKIEKRIVQAGNSIGGAISQDGKIIAVSNYEPGGVKFFKSDDLTFISEIPAIALDGKRSKVVGLIDVPGQKFVFSLFEAGEIWVADVSKNPAQPELQKFTAIGKEPYDALISPDGRYYIAGLFGEDGMTLIDLWHLEKSPRRIFPNYGKGKEKLPVYKMPHLEGWALSGNQTFMPAVALHEVLVADMSTWKEIKKIPVAGQPVFAIANPDGKQIWVNFALPDNHKVQVINAETLKVVKDLEPGKAVLHMEFTPKGEEVWLSIRDESRVEVYRTSDFVKIAELKADNPSGIFFTPRAHHIGQ